MSKLQGLLFALATVVLVVVASYYFMARDWLPTLRSDRGAIDTAWDPLLFSRGLIDHGVTSVFGAAKTGFVALSGPATKGATTLVLARAPQNWRAGDELVIPDPARLEQAARR